MRRHATEKLRDHGVLAEVAMTDKSAEVRRAAVLRLELQPVLVDISNTDGDPSVREAATDRLEALGLPVVPLGKFTGREPFSYAVANLAVDKLLEKPHHEFDEEDTWN